MAQEHHLREPVKFISADFVFWAPGGDTARQGRVSVEMSNKERRLLHLSAFGAQTRDGYF